MHAKTVIAYLLTLFAAAVLVIAAFFKAGDPAMFAEQISGYEVTPASWSPLLAFFFVAAELVLAAALVSFVLPRITLGLNILLMLGFIGVTAWAWAHGNAGDCGCFGRALERGPRDVIIEDTIVVLASLLAIFLLRGFRTRPWQWSIFAILLVPVLILVAFGPSLPIDGLVVGIGPGDDLSDIAIAGLRQPVAEGNVLLVLVAPNCEACETGVTALRAIAGGGALDVIAAVPGGPREAQRWRLQHHPNFPVGYAPQRALRQYYRRLPVTLRLEDGIVRTVWWNEIPTPDQVRANR